MKNLLKTGTILSMLALAGCSSLSTVTYSQPDMALPDQWGMTTASSSKNDDATTKSEIIAQTGWWQNFDDAQLNRLITKALETNNDLAAATIKVRQAQLAAGLAEDAFYPDVSAQ